MMVVIAYVATRLMLMDGVWTIPVRVVGSTAGVAEVKEAPPLM